MVGDNNLQDKTYTGLREKIRIFVESDDFLKFITMIIILNAVTLGIETSKNLQENTYTILHILDKIFIGIFVIEIFLRIFAYRLSFFRSGWNIFDFSIVAISLIPSSGPFSIVRAFRIFRILRLMSVVPQMRSVINALLHAIPGMTSIVMVLVIIFYVCSVLVTQTFGVYPDPKMQELYGSIGASMFSLFQVMTLEGWSEGIAIPTMQFFPWAWAFYVLFIVVTSFAVLNLFIGIIVEAMASEHMPASKSDVKEIEKNEQEDTNMLMNEISLLRKEIAELKSSLNDKS